MRVVYKYVLPREPEFTLSTPEVFKPLCVNMQNDKPTMWAQIFKGNKTIERKFFLIATGERIPSVAHAYIGTLFDGPFVWHLYY